MPGRDEHYITRFHRREQGAYLGAEHEPGAGLDQIKRLDAQRIPSRQERTRRYVNRDESVHPVQALEGAGAPQTQGRSQNLRVGFGAEIDPLAFHFNAQGTVIVDLTVQSDGDSAVKRPQWLHGVGRIDDRETPGSDRKVGRWIEYRVTDLAAMQKPRDQTLDHVLRIVAIYGRCDAAH